METKELINKAFNWYYEEDIAHTNISNEEATKLFMETEHFKEMKYQANGLSTGDRQLTKPAVIKSVCKCCNGKGYIDKSDGYNYGAVHCPVCD